jgi:hypothetical protein
VYPNPGTCSHDNLRTPDHALLLGQHHLLEWGTGYDHSTPDRMVGRRVVCLFVCLFYVCLFVCFQCTVLSPAVQR